VDGVDRSDRPGLVMGRTEARSISNKPAGKGATTPRWARLLEEYGFGNDVERFRSKVERADLLHCMDYLTEIEEWREKAKRSVLEAVERKQHQHYPSQIDHPTVVWRHFKASKDGKEAFKDRGIEPKLRAPKNTDDLRQELAAKQAYIEELEAARSSATEPAAEPTAAPAAVATAEAVTSDIQLARSNYVTLLPTDHDARREELVAIIGAATKGWSDQDKFKACLAITQHIRDATSAPRA
jgi:hypothetical protein